MKNKKFRVTYKSYDYNSVGTIIGNGKIKQKEVEAYNFGFVGNDTVVFNEYKNFRKICGFCNVISVEEIENE